jgi:hypothetical protein
MGEILTRRGVYEGVIALGLAVFFVPLRTPWIRRLLRMLGAAGAAGAIVLLVQRKGWTYHALPGRIALGAVAAVLFGEAFQFPSFRSDEPAGSLGFAWPGILLGALRTVAAAGALVCVVLAARVIRGDATVLQRGQNELAERIEQLSRPGDRVMILDSWLQTDYPALMQANREPGSRYLWLFGLPMLFDGFPAVKGEVPPSSVSAEEEARMLRILDEEAVTHRHSGTRQLRLLSGVQRRGISPLERLLRAQHEGVRPGRRVDLVELLHGARNVAVRISLRRRQT